MATRIKTVEYAFPTNNTNLAATTRYDFAAITLYLPETTARTFRSARVLIVARDNVGTATTCTALLCGIKLGAAAFNDASITPHANTGENHVYAFERDVTSYFNSNFGTGASQTCQVGFLATGPATIDIAAKLILTYEYDDEATTHVKTVKIPLEAGTGALTTTLTELGTNQIPALDSFLPESSKVYRNIWFEICYSDHRNTATADDNLEFQIDSLTAHTTGNHEGALASNCGGMYIWDQGASPAWATNATHQFKARTVNGNNSYNHIAIILCVTYEFDPASSTIINSLMIPMSHVTRPGSTGSSTPVMALVDLWIQEPGTISQVQSGIFACYSQNGATGPVLVAGAASARSYTDVAGTPTCYRFLTQRVDSGAAAGAAWTLARGLNRLSVQVRTSSGGSSPNEVSLWLIINYTSSNDGAGGSRHNRTLIFNVQTAQAIGATSTNSADVSWAFLPDSEGYFITAIGAQYATMAGNTGVSSYEIAIEAQAGELAGAGWYPVRGYAGENFGEGHMFWRGFDITCEGLFRRFTNDPSDPPKMDPTVARSFRGFSTVHNPWPLSCILTKHSIAKTISGDISGSDGGTVTIQAMTARFGKVAETSRVGDGSYSMTWWDDTEPVIVWARETAALVGASEEAYAS